jgi:Ni/Fe-hydrogenase subunit HybB-like protein
MHVLGPLGRFVPIFLVVYLGMKVGDVVYRRAYGDALSLSPQGISWLAEMFIGVVLPLIMLAMPSVRRSPKLLAAACLAVILGVVINRLNCFVIGYHPPFTEKRYFPSITEFAVSAGLVAALLLTYRVAVTYLPILEPRQRKEQAG